MNDEAVRNTVRGFFEKALPGHKLSDDQDIFGSGFVNSLMAMQLVLFVENEFGFSVTEADLDLANFKSVDAIVDLIQRKALQPS